MITEYTAEDAPTVVYRDPKNRSYGSNATITDKHNRSGSKPMITEYTTKGAPAVVTLNVNAKNSLSQGIRQSTNMNDDDMVEARNKT